MMTDYEIIKFLAKHNAKFDYLEKDGKELFRLQVDGNLGLVMVFDKECEDYITNFICPAVEAMQRQLIKEAQ